MAGLFDTLYGEATKAVAPAATPTAAPGPLPQSVQELVRTPEWVNASIPARKELYARWRKEIADPAVTAQAAADKKAKTDLAAQARTALREFEKREFRAVEGGVLNNDLLDLAAQGLASAVGGSAQAIGTAVGSKSLFDFGKSAQADAQGIDRQLSDRTIEQRTQSQERTVASRRDQLAADTQSPLNPRLMALAQRWGGVERIPASSPELQALTTEYDRTGGTSFLPEAATAGRNFLAQPLNKTAQAVGSSAPAIAAGVVGGVPGAVVGGALLGAGQGAEAFDRVMALDDATIMSNPELAARVRSLGGTPQAIAAVRRQAAETANNMAAATNAVIGGAGSFLGARFGAESAVTRGATAQPFLRSAGVEAGQEGTEGALNQATTNLAVQGADPTQAISAGVAPAAVEEALAGLGMTAGLRAVPPVAGAAQSMLPTAAAPAAPAPLGPTTGLTQAQLAAAAANVAAREQRAADFGAQLASEQAAAAGQPTMAAPVDTTLRAPLTPAEVPLLPAPTPMVDAQGRVTLLPSDRAALEAADFAARYAPQAAPQPVPEVLRLPAPSNPVLVDAQGRAFLSAEEQRAQAAAEAQARANQEAADFAARYAPQPASAPPPPAPIRTPRTSSDPDLQAVDELMQAVGLPAADRVDTRALGLIEGLRNADAAAAIDARVRETLGLLPPRAAERFGPAADSTPTWTPQQEADFRAQFDPTMLTEGARAQASEAATRIINDPAAHPEYRTLVEPIILPVVPSQPRPNGASAGVADVPGRGGQPAADTAQLGGGGAGPVAAVQPVAGGQDGGAGAGRPGGDQTPAAGAGRPGESQVNPADQRPVAGPAADTGVSGATAGAVPQGAGGGAPAAAGAVRARGRQAAAAGAAAGAGGAAQGAQATGPGAAGRRPQAGAGAAGQAVDPNQTSLFQATVQDGEPISEATAQALEANDIGGALRELAKKATTKFYEALAARLAPLLDGVTRVELLDNMTDNNGNLVFGGASVDGTVIALNRSTGVAQETLLHEGVHAAVERKLRAPTGQLTPAEREARASLAKLWRDMRRLPAVAARMTPASMESLGEFVAEAMTNRDLQVALDAQPYSLGRAWARFKAIILDFLGLRDRETAFAAAVAAVDTLLTRPSTIITGGTDATDQVNQQGGVQQERQAGNESRQAPEAGRGNRLQRAGPSQEGQAQEGLDGLLYATSIGARAVAGIKATLSSTDRVRSEAEFLAAGTPGGTPLRPPSLLAVGDALMRTFVDHSIDAQNLIDAEAQAVPRLASLWDRVKDAMLTWRNKSDAFFEQHKDRLTEPYFSRLAELAKTTGRTTEDLHREAGAVAQARHALDRTRAEEQDLQDAVDRAQERVDQFDAMEAAWRGSRDRVDALVGRVGTAANNGVDVATGSRLVVESLQTMSDLALSLENAGVRVPKVAQLLRSLDAAALNQATGRNVVDALQTVLTTLQKVSDLVGDRATADKALQRATTAQQNFNTAQTAAPIIERGPSGELLEKLAAPLPGGLRKSVAQQKVAQASPEALELANLTVQAFQQLADLAVANGVADAARVGWYRARFPNYVSFMGDSTRDIDDLAGVSPNRAFLEDADGAQTLGQPLPPMVNLTAKLHQLANVIGSADLRQGLLDVALTNESALVKMAEGMGEKGAARLTVYGQSGSQQVVAKIALMDARMSEGILKTQVLTSQTGQAISKATGFYGRLVTQFVPMFAPINFLRDGMTRAFNFVGRQELTPDQVNKVRGNFASQLAAPGNWAEVWQFVRTGDATGSLRQLRDAGALLLFTDTQVSERTVEDDVKARNPNAAGALRKGGAAVATLFEKYNRLFEAIIPLATFKALRSTGMPEAKAAAVTVDMMNFRSRGTLTPHFNAAYPFFAATAQDARQVVRTLMPNGKPNARAWAELLALSGLAALLYSLARDSDDDDEFGGKGMDALTTDHERNWVIPAGDGTYIKIPIGFGLVQLAWNFGVNSMRIGLGIMSAEDAALNMGKAFFKTMTPTGVSDIDFAKDPAAAGLYTLMPGLLKPVAQAAMNKNFAGGKITYATENGDEYKSEQGRAATPEVYKAIAAAMRESTGVDLAPEIVRTVAEGYLIGPMALATTLVDDREEKGLAPKGFGSVPVNAVASATGFTRLVRPLNDTQELTSKAYARMDQAKEILRRTNVAEPRAEDVQQEDIDAKLARASQAGATPDELELLGAYLVYVQEDNRLRREQGRLRSKADLGEFEQRRMEFMRQFLATAGSH